MGTLLANRRMAPALRARVEASVTGRSGPRSRPSRFRAVVRLLFTISVLVLTVWTFAHNRIAGRELERRRAALVGELQREAASLDAREHVAVGVDETLLRELSATYEGDLVPADWRDALNRPFVHVRGPIEAFASGASIEKAALASTDEAFVRCLLDPPRSRKEHDVFTKVRAAYAATAPLPNASRLNEAYVAQLFLQPAFEARVRAADEHELTTLERRVERAHLGEAKKALAAPILLAVMDEPGDSKVAADLDGERPHEVRVAVVDTKTSTIVMRARKHVDPSAWSQTARADFSSGMDSCGLAYDLTR